MTADEKIAKVKDLRPIDDVFFEVLASERPVCEEILRTILEDPKLTVEDVIVQSSKRNLYGRSVRLDALCTLGNGTKVNVEVQRSDNDDHLRRVRFNAASITVKESQSGDDYSHIPEVIVVYISEFDFLKGGKTIYHVDRVLRETGTVIDNGQHEIFVNTVVDDGSDIADLMNCFTKKQIENKRFPIFSNAVKRLKNTEGGASAVCEVMQKYEAIAREQGLQQGLQQGAQQTLIDLVNHGLLSPKDAAATLHISVDEFHRLMSQPMTKANLRTNGCARFYSESKIRHRE